MKALVTYVKGSSAHIQSNINKCKFKVQGNPSFHLLDWQNKSLVIPHVGKADQIDAIVNLFSSLQSKIPFDPAISLGNLSYRETYPCAQRCLYLSIYGNMVLEAKKLASPCKSINILNKLCCMHK